jgi:hypothetical protein
MLASPERRSFELVLPDEQATRRLAVDVAAILKPGDVVTLSGDLGAGKTMFARAVIRYLAGDDTLEVPSPSFTLIQFYDLPRFPIAHADFYRVAAAVEMLEIGFPEAMEGAAVLIEWPDRAGDLLPAETLDIALMLAADLGANGRRARITVRGAYVPRLERLLALRRFLDDSGFGAAERAYLQGDASTRTYERLTLDGRRAVLMNMPRRTDGPPVKRGLAYSAIAHLAEDVKPFVAVARELRTHGFSAPEIYAADLNEGFLLLEDLGSDRLVAGTPPAPIEERYAAAVDVLVALHRERMPAVVPVAPEVDYRLPRYDLDALLIEVELLIDWYLPQRGFPVDAEARKKFVELWTEALKPALAAEPTWVLRDYHSPNLLWLADRTGNARVGLLDFQDAVLGPCAYDLVSLTQDARIDVPEALEEALLSRYMKARRAADRGFDIGGFFELYALMGAQRASKVLGIFSRLDRRDGKSQYLRHQPRVWRNLRRSLAHPALAGLKAWYDIHVPAPPSGS